MRLGLRITIINYVEMNRRIYIQAVDPNNERRPPGLVRHARWKYSTSLGEDNHASRTEFSGNEPNRVDAVPGERL